MLKSIILLILFILIIVSLSLFSNRLWGTIPEKPPAPKNLIIREGITLSQFGLENNISNPSLKEVFELKARSDLERNLNEFGTPDQIRSFFSRKMALASEQSSKNWRKIAVKFALWFLFLSMVYLLFRNRKVTQTLRRWVLFMSLLIFGVIMGSDPGPMGTVKDAIHLYGTSHVVFPPRMIALVIFLLLVFFANKFICAWGCQAGTLQDLLFRLNQTTRRSKTIIGKRIKIPFVWTNTIRTAFFILFATAALLWGVDIIEPIDPFKIYNPAHLGIIGGVFMGILLPASLFIYRPWCHFFCPFGFIGWIVEKISLIKIRVNYGTCIACQKCVAACPSTVMGAIYRGDKKTIPDCFACYTCRDACPTGSISFSTGR